MIRLLARFSRNTRGVAATEFVLWLTVLVLPLLNVVDLSMYMYQRMQVEAAAQAAVQAAWNACNTTTLLPTKNCTGVLTTMQTAAQGTSLGTNVSLTAANVTEGYYCSNGSGTLVLVGTAGSTSALPTKPSPFTCAATSGSSKAPGDYLKATTSYTYSPLFPYASIVSLLNTTVTKTAWMRLD
ncbi:TadE/TadG family type IV pilus assembly protein [Asticcacaulis taihuensis]|uniref:TadE/TadG family type IV pilus assembly protein n=1 Tax=Asticcacaulis taihuensis TaxID=260084 RepID=UPI003F7B4E36